jgi:Tic22-like family
MASRPQAWFRSLSRTLGLPLCAAGLIGSAALTTLLSSAQSALAIPEADAIKKLQVVPVFVLTDAKGVPLPIPRDKNLVLPLYLESAKANQQLAALQKSNPTLKAQVVAIPLNVMNAKVTELNQQLKDKSKPLVAPIVINEGDRQQAVTLLKAQGLTEKQINEGLNVPVFFTKPFLTISSPEGPRGVFYLSYETLQNSLAKLSASDREKLKPQVADLTAVLREIIKAKDDNYIIFPTPEYFRLVKETQDKGKASKPAN